MSAEKINRLIALAMSTTSEEEARTAALTAVRLISKGGFKIQNPAIPRPEVRQTRAYGAGFADPSWSRDTQQVYQDMINEIFRGTAGPPPGWGSFRPPRPSRSEPSGAPNGGMWDFCEVTGLRCHKCSRKIGKGEKMYVVGFGQDVQTWCGDH